MADLIARENQLLAPDAQVDLYEVDLSEWDAGVLRKSPHAQRGEPLLWNGAEYGAFAIEMTGISTGTQGRLPTPTLSVALLDPSLIGAIIRYNNLVGAPVRKITTYVKYLDNGKNADSSQTMPVEEFFIQRLVGTQGGYATFELSSFLDLSGRIVPARPLIKNQCLHPYRTYSAGRFHYEGVTCPYSGDQYWDEYGNPQTDPSRDSCGRGISECKKRFGSNGNLPTTAVPGMSEYRG